MGLSKGERFDREDVFIDYDFENVMFRWDHLTHKIYRKFYSGVENPQPISHENRLFNDAFLYGDEITREEYLKGKHAS